MHLPDGVMSAPVCLVTNGLAAAAVGYSAWRVSRDPLAPAPAKWCLVAGAVFAVQLLNFPLASGASGHLVGAVFAGALLGPWAGILTVSTVLAVQAIAFADGGVTTLGANIVNMAIIGAALGGWARSGWPAALAVPVAAAICAIQLAIGADRPLGEAMAALVPFHLALGLIEACVTWAALALLARKPAIATAVAAIVLAIVVAPWASTLPDGLEAALNQLRLAGGVQPPDWVIAPDYAVSGVQDQTIALIAAGVLGAMIVVGLTWFLALAARLQLAVADARRRNRT
jgi:cobalt/nickel transport system permease protein